MNLMLFGLIICSIGASAVQVQTGTERVVGGNIARVADFPFNAAIHYKKLFLCSGAFIGTQHIITTADCVDPYSTGTALKDVSVKLGSVKSAHEIGVYEYPVFSVTIHPLYTRKHDSKSSNRDFILHYYNIAIITLTNNVETSSTVSPITLPAVGSPSIPDGSTLTLVGWGHKHGLVSDNLEYVSLMTMNVQICINLSGGDPSVGTGNNLCTEASDPTSGREEGACTMDHGGPLIMPGVVSTIHGLVSWADCESESGGMRPTIYTSIVGHRPWIRTVTGL